MKEEAYIRELLRKFIQAECNEEETLKVIDYMQTKKGQQYYSELMDETSATESIPSVSIDPATIENKFSELEERINRSSSVSHVSFWKIAAAVSAILIVSAFVIHSYLTTQTVSYATDFGKIQTIVLPDSSVVILNGNSSISYSKHWDKNEVREVKLQGEAFFKVKHTRTHQRFIVKADKNWSVEVLGTEFNVKSRQRGTTIVLSSGKIQLNINDANKTDTLLMKPGELVAFTPKSSQHVHKIVNPKIYTSWTNQILTFQNTPLHEVVLMLEETYDLQIEVADKKLLQKKMSGTAPIENIDIFFEALSGSFDLEVTKTNNQVRIEAAN